MPSLSYAAARNINTPVTIRIKMPYENEQVRLAFLPHYTLVK